MVTVCERFGWTLDQYLSTPTLFLDAIAIKMRVEARLQREQEAKAQSRLK